MVAIKFLSYDIVLFYVFYVHQITIVIWRNKKRGYNKRADIDGHMISLWYIFTSKSNICTLCKSEDHKYINVHSSQKDIQILYRVSQIKVATIRFSGILSQTVGNFFDQILLACYTCSTTNFFIKLTATLMKLRHIKRDHPVHIISTKCPPSAETHAAIFWSFSQTVGNF